LHAYLLLKHYCLILNSRLSAFLMTNKRVKQVTFILILLIHFSYVGVLLYSYLENPYIIGGLLLILLMLVVTYIKKPVRPQHNSLDEIHSIFFVFIGAFSTYVLHTSTVLSAVLAASMVGLVVSFVPNIFKNNITLQSMPAAVYCGTFVGMTSAVVASGYLFIFLASCITGLLLVSASGVFHNMGGKLGTLAFGGVLLTFVITLIAGS